MTPKLSIIILNWNTGVYLEKCLSSIFSGSAREWLEVIVVDNNSKEDISDIVKKFPGVHLIRNNYNLGFAAGNNIGFRASKGDYVMTLNPDTVLGENTLERLVCVLDEDDSVGIAAAALTEWKFADPSTHFGLFSARRCFCHDSRTTGKSLLTNLKLSLLTWSWSTEPATSAGGPLFGDRFFEEDYFLFGEEYSLCKHIRNQGFKIRVVPGARLEHLTSVTFRSDHKRLKMAVKLGTAVVFRIRERELGSLVGSVETFIRLIEAVFLAVSLSVVNQFEKARRRERSLMITRLSATAVSSFMMLTSGEKYLSRVNGEAALFFNDGVPQSSEEKETK